MKISEGVLDNQFADLAVASDGTIYVTWRQFENNRSKQDDALVFVKSTDGGRTFTRTSVAVRFESFDAADFAGDSEAAAKAHEQAFENADGPESDAEPSSAGDARDCGSGSDACQSGFVFFRHDSQPRVTADPSGDAKTLWIVYDATRPGTEVSSDTTYNTALFAPDGTLMVGQGAIYINKTVDGGRTWSTPLRLAPTSVGHQFFPDINVDAGRLYAVSAR
jgi:hypothetical protein